MKRADVDQFEKIVAQLESLHAELSLLSKKSPNDALNEFKLTFVNATIADANAMLGEKYRPFASFDSFSLDSIPSNSDVTFMLSQYLECAEKFRSDHIRPLSGYYFWVLEGEGDRPTVRSAVPKKLR